MTMKNTTQLKWRGVVAGLAMTMLATSSFAQNANGLGEVVRAEQLLGREIYSSDGQKIGKLDNLVMDLESGRILYGAYGTIKHYAIAPQVLTTVTGKDIRASVPKAKFDSAPQFSGDINKPGARDQASFVYQVYQYYGQQVWWQGNTPANQGAFNNVWKQTELKGANVVNVNNEPIGKLVDTAVNLSGGRIVAFALAPDSSLKLGDDLYPIPPMLTANADKKGLTANITREQLSSAQHFNKNSWPNFDASYVSQVYQHFGKQPFFQAGTGTGTLQPTGRSTPNNAGQTKP